MAGRGITDLRVNEVNIIARQIGEDPLKSITEGTASRWEALALCAWLHAKRTDPLARKESFLEMTVDQISEITADDDADDPIDPEASNAEAAGADPTVPGP